MTRTLEGVCILAIDDESDALEALSLFLEMKGADVRCATSAAEALRILASGLPDVVLSDLSMPGMDGIAMMGELRQSGVATPAIAVSAMTDPTWTGRARDAGFDRLIPKPVALDVLEREIARVVRRQL
jgi:two-component system CheB/CheR fusion protein